MDKEQAINIVSLYAREVTKEFQPERVVLFGSHATGAAGEDSDIDVAVVFNEFTGDALAVSARLCGLMRRVSTLIEPILVDRAHDRSGFVEEILRTGEVIYP